MRRRAAIIAAGSMLLGARAVAQPLSPAQIALFETPHLAELAVPVALSYRFLREEDGRDPVEDRIRLEVRGSAEPGRRDVSAEFLTGPRNLPYPPAQGFRGNPLLIFALDRDARELSAATGGSMHWFRERIRRAFATGAEQRATQVELDGQRLAATEFRIEPFLGEPRARRFQARRYAFVVAEGIPGTIHSIRSATPAGEGGGAFAESIVFDGAAPIGAGP